MKSKNNSGDDRIGFRLSTDQLVRLDAVAAAAGVSRHQAARELLVLALTGVGREEVLAVIGEVAVTIDGVHERLEELTDQQLKLTHNIAAAVEWLSLTIVDPEARALDTERLHEVVTSLFFGIGDQASLSGTHREA